MEQPYRVPEVPSDRCPDCGHRWLARDLSLRTINAYRAKQGNPRRIELRKPPKCHVSGCKCARAHDYEEPIC